MAGKLKPKTYCVTNGNANEAPRLIRALTRAGAIAHAAKGKFEAEVASHDQLYALARNGIEVENAVDEQLKDQAGA